MKNRNAQTINTRAALWLTGLAMLGLSGCGPSQNLVRDTITASAQDQAIVNGVSVTGNESMLKHVVALAKTDDRGRLLGIICTATVIDENLLLTAAHCVGDGIDNMVVLFESNLNQVGARGVQWAQVDDGYVHPRYLPNTNANFDMYDVAVLRFKGNLPRNYEPTDLMAGTRDVRKGSKVTLIGWGRTSNSHNNPTTVLQTKDVAIEYLDYQLTEVVFTQTDGGACNGDSGGPAFVRVNGRDVQMAIASRVGGPSEDLMCSGMAIYTLVGPHLKFIEMAATELAPQYSIH